MDDDSTTGNTHRLDAAAAASDRAPAATALLDLEDALAAQHALVQVLHEVTAVCNAASGTAEAAEGCLAAICRSTGWQTGHLWLADAGDTWRSAARWRSAGTDERLGRLADAVAVGPAGRLVAATAADAVARWTPELHTALTPVAAELATALDLVAAFAFPVIVRGSVGGVLQLLAATALPPSAAVLEAVTQVCGQLGQVLDRERTTAALRRSEDRCRRIIETAGDAFVEIDADGAICDWNRRAEETFGWARGEVLGRELAEVLLPEAQRGAHRAGLRRYAQTGEGRAVGRLLELSALRRDGREVPVEVTIWPIDDGGCWHFGAFLRDVSVQRSAQEALREARERFQKAFEHAPIGMALVGLDGRFEEVNRALCDMLGYGEAALLGLSTVEVVHPEDVGVGADLAARAAMGVLAAYTVERRYVRADGSSVWGRASVAAVTDGGERPRAFVVQIQDITEQRRAAADLAHRALHDPLTGLANRALFLDRLAQALSRSERRPASLAVLFCDLDGFKAVNDGLGHEVGDLVLATVATRLRATVRPADTVARLGGDEFVVLCEDLAGAREAMAIAERLTIAVGQPIPLEDGACERVTTSVGVALADDAAADPLELLRQADTAMYRAKEAGKAQTALYGGVALPARGDGVAALRAALDEDRLVLRWLPTVRLADGQVVGVEALLRYRGADGRLVGPDEFLAVAEDSGLIVEMGAWALAEARAHAARWRDGGLRVAVNLSARELGRPELLAALGDGADGLAVEISEPVLVRAPASAVDGLSALRAGGMAVGLDDAGTSGSSPAALSRLPVDYIKLDRGIVAGIGTRGEDTATVAAVVGLARALDLETIAEGVETSAQAQHLRRLGCELAQGHLFAGPLDAAEVDALLASRED